MEETELIARAEAVGTTENLPNLIELLELLPGQDDPEVISALIEAASTWAYLFEIPDNSAADQLVSSLETWAASAGDSLLADQARQAAELCGDMRLRSARLRQEKRIRSLSLADFHTWPLELRLLAPGILIGEDSDHLPVFAQRLGTEPNEDVRAAIAQAMRRARKPRKGSRLRIRLEKVLLGTRDRHAASVVEAWNSKPKWRGTPRPDPSLALADRLEEWVWEVDERYGIPGAGEITRQQVGMFLKMAEELCGIETPAGWAEAATYFESENFHGLVRGCRARARSPEA